MSRKTLLSVALLAGAAVSIASPASADDAAPSIPALDARVSLELREADAGDVFRTLETVLFEPASGAVAGPEVHIRVETPIDRKLTICLRDVTVRTVLAAIRESLHCTASWEPDGDGYLLVIRPDQAVAVDERPEEEAGSLDQPIDLKLDGAKLSAVVRTVGAITDRKVVVDEQLGERLVTISVHATPLRKVLDLLCKQADCRWHETALGVLAFDPR